MKQLTYRNNWEYDEYYIDGVRVTSLTLVKIDDVDYTVTASIVTEQYMDMGRLVRASSVHYFVTTLVFGSNRKFDLNEIIRDKTIYAIEYLTEGK